MNAPGDYYDRGVKTNLAQKIWHWHRFRMIKKLLPKINSRVLDVGCHGGMLTEEMGKNLPRAEVYGIDIDPEVIAYAQKERPQIHFQVATSEKLSFNDEYFDLITCFDSIEHVKEPKKVLAEIRRCLKKGGRLMVLAPTESRLFRLIWYFWTKGRGRVWQGAHLQHFIGHQLEELIENQGFKIDQSLFTHLGMMRLIKATKN